jgi:RHS repeat-associated protein
MALSVTYTTFNGRIVKENRGGTESFYAPDTLGSTAALLSTTGSVTDTYDYWPFGEIRNHNSSSTTPFTFVGTLGYYLQILNNFFYVRARYLRQALARWQSVDPLWPRQRPYSYADCNPVSMTDPMGRQARNAPSNSGMGNNTSEDCGVYVCSEHTMTWPLLGWVPTHKYVCVTGPHGGCSGDLGPGANGQSQVGNPGRYCPDDPNYNTTCVKILSGCNLASAACECVKYSIKGGGPYPGPYVPGGRSCYDYPYEIARCACIGSTSRDCIKLILEDTPF